MKKTNNTAPAASPENTKLANDGGPWALSDMFRLSGSTVSTSNATEPRLWLTSPIYTGGRDIRPLPYAHDSHAKPLPAVKPYVQTQQELEAAVAWWTERSLKGELD